jgi:hypothetical protein
MPTGCRKVPTPAVYSGRWEALKSMLLPQVCSGIKYRLHALAIVALIFSDEGFFCM